MANDYLPITKTNRPMQGSQVIRLANLIVEARDLVRQLNSNASHMHDGATFTAVETNIGLPGGTGGNFVTMLQQIHDILNTSTAVSDENRLARLDEFTSRLSGQ